MTIHTAQSLEAMTDAQRLEAFEAMGAAAYGTARFGAEFCRRSGWAPKTIGNWRAPNGPGVPVQAILLLQEFAGRKSSEAIMLEAFRDVARDLNRAARTMSTAASMVSDYLAGQVSGDGSTPADAKPVGESRL